VGLGVVVSSYRCHAFTCIPLIGQIAISFWQLWEAIIFGRRISIGASRRQVKHLPSASNLSTPEKFSEFKAKQIKPGIERSCKSDAKAYVGFDGKIPITASNFCECYARIAVEIITKEDLVYQENHSGYPTDFEDRMKAALRAQCRV